MNTNESHNFPQGDGNAAGCHSLGQSNHREGNCIKALCFNFLKKEGNAAGVNSTPGHLSRLPGNRVKARRFFLRVSQWAKRTGMAGASKAAAKCSNSVFMGNGLAVSNLNAGGAL